MWDTKSRTWAEKKGQLVGGEEGAAVLICMSSKVCTTGRMDFKPWFSSYVRFGQGCMLGFGVLYSLMGHGLGLKATLRLAILRRML